MPALILDDRKGVIMTKIKLSMLVCLMAAMLSGCGDLERSDKPAIGDITVEEVFSETAVTTAAVEAAETSTETSAPMTEETTTTAASETTTTTTEPATTTEIQTTEQNRYPQTMGNEVLPQSVDNYATATFTTQTSAAVTEEEPIVSEESPEEQEVEQYTSQGYRIEVRDGVTYVGGVPVVNKSYSLPQNYGGGLDNEALQAFYEMQSAASQDGIWLTIVSGYRSYWYQDQLYWGYVYSRGQSEADRFSAKAGYSEHQTGLAMDLNNANRSFIGTPEAAWIEEHCAEYGFIVRYPDGKEEVTGFMYEPWHVRYLGKEMAESVTESGLALEEYLGIDSYYH